MAKDLLSSGQTALQRLNTSSDNWLCIATQFGSRTGHLVGKEHSIAHYCEPHQRRRKPRMESAKMLG